MHQGELNDGVKYYAITHSFHGGISFAGALLAIQEYWLFLLVGVPVGAFFVFDKITIRALKESKKLRLAFIVETVVIWGLTLIAGWLPTGGKKETFAIFMLLPIIFAFLRTNRELRKVIIGHNARTTD